MAQLFFGNLPLSFTQKDLTKLLSYYGSIVSIKLITKEKNKIGFVALKEAKDANEAKKQLNKKTINNHQIYVDFARSSNNLIINDKNKSNKLNKLNKFNKRKRKFEGVPSMNPNKRQKVTISNKKIPQSRIVRITNVPNNKVLKELNIINYQYIIYPSNDDINTGWILHKTVEDAQNTINNIDKILIDNNYIIGASFARKLNKMYRVKILNITNITSKTTDSIKKFINNYFNKHYKFDQEENKKQAKLNKYVWHKRNTNNNHKKKSIHHDVIQNIKILSNTSNMIIVEFKKVDYALYCVESMNGIDFNSKEIFCHFELENEHNKFNQHIHNNNSRDDIDNNDDNDNDNDKIEIIKMFNIDESVKYEQLKELIINIIGDDNILKDIIYPSPDSLPESQSAWICLSSEFDDKGKQLINKLNRKSINNHQIGVIFGDKSIIKPQNILIRNLPKKIKENDIYKLFTKFGKIKNVSMKGDGGWCFITFNSILSSKYAIKEMNGFKFDNNKMIAVDYTLPKDVYDKVQQKWKKYRLSHPDPNQEIKEKKSVWTLYKFMNDYQEKSFYKKPRKKLSFKENIEIPVTLESTNYDWNKWFLIGYRLNIIEYETNCKIIINNDNDNHNIKIFSDNKHNLEKCKLIINEILNNKKIREIGYNQIMNIPFDLEHNDFDWILYLNGENYEKRKEFQLNTGCSFAFKGKLSSHLIGNKKDLLKLELIASTKKSLERGVQFMKNNFLSTNIKNNRENDMNFKYIKRIYFPKQSKNNYGNIDYISLIKSPNGQRLQNIEKMTKCKIRTFGTFNFVNKTNIKSYCKIMAKNEDDLENGYKMIHDLIFNDEIRNNAINENYQILNNKKKNNNIDHNNKSFWFYNGDANEGRTIFVRNLPFDITEKEIKEKFNQFGNIISIKLVIDKISGNLRGSGFIQFDDKQCVEQLISNNEDIRLNGRKLIINQALNKKKAREIEHNNSRKRDKRNLYLAKEGIMLNEDEMNKMDKTELNKRINLWKAKKLKLENPNFHISKTRLSIKHIPSKVKEKQLKKIFHEKAMELRQENKDNDKNNEIYKYRFPKINQIKIVRNIENGKSKKFGFIEFREHSDSLLVLRALNNKEIENIDTKLHIEFAIENQKKLHIHKLKVAKYKKNKTT